MSNTNKKIPWKKVPKVFEWKAQDEDGAWCGYVNRPIEGETGWDKWLADYELLKFSKPNPTWKNTLEKRPK